MGLWDDKVVEDQSSDDPKILVGEAPYQMEFVNSFLVSLGSQNLDYFEVYTRNY